MKETYVEADGPSIGGTGNESQECDGSVHIER